MNETNLLSGSVKSIPSATIPKASPSTSSPPRGYDKVCFQQLLQQLQTPLRPIISSVSVQVSCVCASFLGPVLGMEDGRVILIKSDDVRQDLARHKSKVTSLCAGRQVVVSAADHEKLSLWTLDDKKEKETPEDFQTETEAFQTTKLISLTPDGQRLAYGPCPLKVWNLPVSDLSPCYLLKMVEVAAFKGDSNMTSLAIAPNGQVVIGVIEGVLNLFPVLEDEVELKHNAPVTRFSIATDSTFLVSGTKNNSLNIWDLRTKELLHTEVGSSHPREVNCLHISPDNRFVVWGANDRSLNVLNLTEKRQVARLIGHRDIVEHVQGVNTHHVVSRDQRGIVKVWSLEEMKEIMTLFEEKFQPGNSAFCVALDGKLVFSASANMNNVMWSLDEKKETRIFQGHTDLISCVSVHGDLIVTGSHDHTLRVWKRKDSNPYPPFVGHTDKVLSVSILPDGKRAVSGSADQTLQMWELGAQDPKSLINANGSVNCISVLSEEKVLIGLSANEMELHNRITPKLVFTGHSNRVNCVFFLEKDTWLSGSSDATLKIWSIKEEKDRIDTVVKSTLYGHTSSVNCVSVSTEKNLADRLAVSGSDDKTVRVWNLNEMKQKAVLYGHTASVKTLDIRSVNNKKYAMSGADDYTVKVWSLEEMILVMSIKTEHRCSSLAFVNDTEAIFGFHNGNATLIDLPPIIPDIRTVSGLCNTIEKDRIYYHSGQVIKSLEDGDLIPIEIAGRLVLPYYFNALHICAHFNHSDRLKAYLSNGVAIIRGAFGSPLTIALKNHAWESVDVLVQYLTDQQAPLALSAFAEITDDLPELMRVRSTHIVTFFNSVLRKPRCLDIPRTIAPVAQLPVTAFSADYNFECRRFAQVKEGQMVEMNTEVVEFMVTLFKWNFAAGSTDSLEFLRALKKCANSQVLTTPFVEHLISVKWKAFRTFITVLTVLYASSLLILMFLFTDSWNSKSAVSMFLSMNVVFLLYEGVQCSVNGWDYFRDLWNYVDLIRYLASLFWGFLAYNNSDWLYLRLFVVCLCFYRGFTYFNAFNLTLRYLRLTLKVVKEIYVFFVILSYISLSFCMLFALLNSGIATVSDIWNITYGMLLGNFRTANLGIAQELCYVAVSLLNVIFMFNLLSTLLVTAPDKVAEQIRYNRQRLLLLIECESLLFWKRNDGQRTFLVTCRKAEEQRSESIRQEDRKPEDNSRLEQINAKLDKERSEVIQLKSDMAQLKAMMMEVLETVRNSSIRASVPEQP